MKRLKNKLSKWKTRKKLITTTTKLSVFLEQTNKSGSKGKRKMITFFSITEKRKKRQTLSMFLLLLLLWILSIQILNHTSCISSCCHFFLFKFPKKKTCCYHHYIDDVNDDDQILNEENENLSVFAIPFFFADLLDHLIISNDIQSSSFISIVIIIINIMFVEETKKNLKPMNFS